MLSFIIATTGFAFQKEVPVKSSSIVRGILHEPLAYATSECSIGNVVIQNKDDTVPEGYRLATTAEAVEFQSQIAHAYYAVELTDGFIKRGASIVNYAYPTSGYYGHVDYYFWCLICDVYSPAVSKIEIVECLSDCGRIINKSEAVPEGWHYASAAEANKFREEMGSYMGKDEIAQLTDAQFIANNLELKMTVSPNFRTVGIVRDL